MLHATRIPKSGAKRLLAGIWPKRAVSQGSQKAVLIARLQATRIPKSGSKRLLARIWPKRAVSQGSQKGGCGPKRPLPRDPSSVNVKGLCAKLPAPRDRGSPGANPTVWFQAGFWKGFCAELPAPRDRGSPGANPTVWFQAGFCKGFCAELPAPRDRGSPGANRGSGFKPVFVPTWGKPSKKESPPREGGLGG